jgi:hypothetical protein
LFKNEGLKTTKKVTGDCRLHNRTFKIYTIIQLSSEIIRMIKKRKIEMGGKYEI